LPATPPPDIDIELWNQSLDKITALRPAKLFLTHFGYSHDPNAHIARYRERLAKWSELVKTLLESGKPEEAAGREFVDAIAAETNYAVSPTEADHYIFNGGLYLSWLACYVTRKNKKKNRSRLLERLQRGCDGRQRFYSRIEEAVRARKIEISRFRKLHGEQAEHGNRTRRDKLQPENPSPIRRRWWRSNG